jgi:hypothetical protein
LGVWQRRIQNNLLSRRYWGYENNSETSVPFPPTGWVTVGDQSGGGVVVVSEGVK